ncbi:MAG TPA: family 20 glycosylhydrolase [Acidobacteriaceae bacterium]|nr:family 20 glycosylhydrolase [Acidobacteriaceae bacterium]
MTLLVSSLFAGPVSAQAALPLMPLPAQVKPGTGEFLINNGFGVILEGYREPRLDKAKQRFLDLLSRQTGIPLWREAALNKPMFFVKTAGPSAPVQEVGEDESYHLEITTQEIHLQAANPLGILHGLQTFLQLVHITPQGFAVPAMTIDDQPRFPWRGLMLDVGRHFMPLDVVYRTLDGMEAVKLNVFHWHLSDNQGFRVESKKFPLLQEKGSDGLFYTQDEIREVIAYARDRGIRVVPEFDMPGHTTAWFVGYPDLASGPGPYQIERKWGIFDPAMDPSRESTYTFLDGFIGEMAALFPDAYFHVGGDECNGKEWDRNPRIQQFMKDHGLKDNAALQASFSTRVQKLVAAHNKIMVGWDEVLQPNTPKDVVIQSWRGPEFVGQAVKGGNRAMLSAGYYIDLNESAAEHYLADPEGAGPTTLTSDESKKVLGGEATMWSEYVTPETVDSRIWPRTAAIAERLWSPRNTRDVASMYERLAIISQKLEDYGLKHNSSYPAMLTRMSGEPDPLPLRVFGDVMQPPREYAREELREYDAFTPLNHMVDAIPPESNTARQFSDIVDRIIAGKATTEDWDQAQEWLVLWRDNDVQLQPLLPRSDLTKELAPVSTNLHFVSQAGLDAIGYLREHHHAPPTWKTRQIDYLKKSEKPQAILLNMVAPAVLKLVQATP